MKIQAPLKQAETVLEALDAVLQTPQNAFCPAVNRACYLLLKAKGVLK